MKRLLVLLLLLACVTAAEAAPKKVRVFVALCDNRTQGIIPVGTKVGNGDDPDSNLYWGCSDGLGSHFRRSPNWKVQRSENDVSPIILRRLALVHRAGDVELIAEAYRGSEMRRCLEDFEAAVSGGEHDLVVFIGHNGLMDFTMPEIAPTPQRSRQAMVLCCQSESYFRPRLAKLGCQPLLLTRQLMYPGSFILHDVVEEWRRGAGLSAIRQAAGKAYARNQKISVTAGTGIFAPLE